MKANRFLYVVVFISGMTTLALELAASRILGNVFGTSNIVWANVIGLMLLYLTVGYFWGGRWADRSPYPKTLYRNILWGAFLSALIPLVSRPILQGAAVAFSNLQASLALGSFVSVLLLFSIPVTLLGTVSPFVIRLAVTDINSAGRVSGQIYAISTFGSILGTFLPTLIIIPEFGTTLTFLFFAGVLYLVAFVGMWSEIQRKTLYYLWMPLAITILALILPSSALRPAFASNKMLFEDDSAYNYIQVQEDLNGYRFLYLNEGQGIHSQWHPTQIAFNRTWDFFLSAPYFNDQFLPSDMQSLLVIGLATGTIPRQHIAVYGNLPMDGIEIDPEIVHAGELFFDMNKEKMPSLNAIVGDGRYELNRLSTTYTVIGIDAYRPPYIPWHLTTVQFFQSVKDHLASNGVVVINVGRTLTDRRLVDALTTTLLLVFPTVHAMDVPNSFNTILVATLQPSTDGNLAQNMANLPQNTNVILKNTLQLAQNSLVQIQTNGIVFTDDRAPVETLTDSLVLNFLLNDGTEIFR